MEGMTTLSEIKQEIDRLTERRAQVFQLLGQAFDPALAREHEEIEKSLAKLWEDHRAARARLRFGERERIIARARQEERIDRAA
jgi:hypothetical protein